MNRQDILDIACDEDATEDERYESMKSAIDDIEGKFSEIKDLLDDFNLDNLDKIVEAYEIAKECATDLY